MTLPQWERHELRQTLVPRQSQTSRISASPLLQSNVHYSMPLKLYNTLTNKVEEFAPAQDNTVRMYDCGPTVYDYGHIGNFRTFVAVDILRRFLLQSGYKLNPGDEYYGRG